MATSTSTRHGNQRRRVIRPLDLTRLEALALQELVRAGGQAVVKDTLEDRLYGLTMMSA